MTDERSRGKGCLKKGCLGCTAVLVLGVIGLGTIVALQLLIGSPEVIRESPSRVYAETARRVDAIDPALPLEIDGSATGRVVLDIRYANFDVVAAKPGEPLRLEADYNSGSYRLEESIEPDGELGWTYRLTFDRRSQFNFIHIDPDNRLTLYVPAGTPLVIEGSVGIGQTRMELGGLLVRDIDLETGIGSHRIDFDDPLIVPMGSLVVRGSIGELSIRSLGNASPEIATVSHSIGELQLGLDGDWRNDSLVSVRSRIGESRISLPGIEFGLELLGSRIMLGERSDRGLRDRPPPPPGAPLIRLKSSHGLGQLSFTD